MNRITTRVVTSPRRRLAAAPRAHAASAAPPVANGRYIPLSELTARAIFAPITLSVRYAIDELVTAITAAANGEGKVVIE